MSLTPEYTELPDGGYAGGTYDPAAARRAARRAALAPYAKGFLGALVAAILLALSYLVYVDHQRVTAMWVWVNQKEAQIQQQQQRALTPPPAGPAASASTPEK